MHWVYDYAKSNPINSARDYPYTGRAETCKAKRSGEKVRGHTMVPRNNA